MATAKRLLQDARRYVAHNESFRGLRTEAETLSLETAMAGDVPVDFDLAIAGIAVTTVAALCADSDEVEAHAYHLLLQAEIETPALTQAEIVALFDRAIALASSECQASLH